MTQFCKKNNAFLLLKLSENPCRPVYRPRKAGAASKLWAPAEDSRSASSKLWPRRVLQGTQTDYKQFLYKGKQRNSKWIKWHPNIFQRGLNQRGQNDTCNRICVFNPVTHSTPRVHWAVTQHQLQVSFHTLKQPSLLYFPLQNHLLYYSHIFKLTFYRIFSVLLIYSIYLSSKWSKTNNHSKMIIFCIFFIQLINFVFWVILLLIIST